MNGIEMNQNTMDPLSSSSFSSTSKPHIIIFPFMAKGHTIPLLHLARLLLHRRTTVLTIFTTPANHPFISQFLSGADISILDLPIPHNIPGLPPGTESTDNLPSMSLFLPFVTGIKLLQPMFEDALANIHLQSPISCIISDGFLPWTLQSASRFGIPRLSFLGMGYYATALSHDAVANDLLSLHESNDEPFALTEFPWIKLTRNDFDDPFDKKDPRGPHLDFIFETVNSTLNSHGLLMNTFYEMEQAYADPVTTKSRCKYWNIGPLCLAQPQKTELPTSHKPKWIHWLDHKSNQGCPVLYIAFGSQARVSPAQLREIALGLNASKVNYLWLVKNSELAQNDAFKDKASERGMIVNEWVDQKEILEHPAVQGFLSHCGWNSVLEGICAGVPILAWPMMAEQFLNGKFVVEEIKVGLRVKTVDGSSKGFVAGMSLKESIVELMEGEKGNALRGKVKEVAVAARKAMEEGGSSWSDLNNLVAQLQEQKKIKHLLA